MLWGSKGGESRIAVLKSLMEVWWGLFPLHTCLPLQSHPSRGTASIPEAGTGPATAFTGPSLVAVGQVCPGTWPLSSRQRCSVLPCL